MSTGKVYLVGAGPGDMGLITLKGYRLLQQADVILYDHLLSMDLLAAAKDGCEKIPVGKRASATNPKADIRPSLGIRTTINHNNLEAATYETLSRK